MSMCQCDEQYARERVPLWDRKSISAELLKIRILLTCLLWRYDLWSSREYLLIVFSVRAVYPIVSSRTLPARIRHDPTSWMM